MKTLDFKSKGRGKHTIYTFKCHITGKIISSRKFTSHLKSLDMTRTQYLMNLNNITELPKCKICGKDVYIKSSKKDIYDPKYSETCHDVKCKNSLTSIKRNTSAMSTGNHWSQNLSKDEWIIRNRKSSITQLENGTHVSLNKKNYIHNNIKFASKAEMYFYIKYSRVLSKHYDLQKKVCIYNDNSIYIADFVLKNNSKLPNVIEIKSRHDSNFNKNMYGDFTKNNYEKFKSVINSGLSLLIVNVISKNSFSNWK